MTETEIEGMIRKVEALLAKAERTENEHEAEACNAMAQKLIAKYSIDQAVLGAARLARGDAAREPVVYEYFCTERNTKLIKAKRELITMLARINSGFPVIGPNRRYIQVTAHESDMRMIKTLFASLLLQMARAMTAAERRGEVVGTIGSWRVSYAHAYVRTVCNRLHLAKSEAMREHQAANSGVSTALVVQGRDVAVQQRYVELFGETRSARRIPNNADSNVFGRGAGYRDGQQADIGQNGYLGTTSSTDRKEIGS